MRIWRVRVSKSVITPARSELHGLTRPEDWPDKHGPEARIRCLFVTIRVARREERHPDFGHQISPWGAGNMQVTRPLFCSIRSDHQRAVRRSTVRDIEGVSLSPQGV